MAALWRRRRQFGAVERARLHHDIPLMPLDSEERERSRLLLDGVESWRTRWLMWRLRRRT
jgi:hypothetical protein